MDEIIRLMTEQLRDAYSAEKQALRAMPRMMKKASAQSLKDALQMHVEQTEGQVERLEKALELVGGKLGRKVCEGMRGIIEEGQSELEDYEKGPLLDTLIVAAQQRIEHYEIASYGTMAALAKVVGQQEVAKLLAETLQEERQTDEKLTQLAESELNPAAIKGAQSDEPANDRRSKRGAAA
ncbi:ferritin-like domain-containing protein [Dankookia sp. GCM10030260]|uniref:YciE/YciF ferroxidase family protein n=1 Tax=Dankookia sp. GCM10030260 TaxID=3273390 RepID=UPI00360B2507